MSTSTSPVTAPGAIVAVEVIILGAGPAGCACALWLHEMGRRCALVDTAPKLCSGLRGLHFTQDWVLGQPGASLDALAHQYAQHIESMPWLSLHLGVEVAQLHRDDDGTCQLTLTNGQRLSAQAVVLATGLQPRHPANYFNDPQWAPLDALSLTRQRDQLRPQRILLLGGGDNAVENALYLHDHGHQVTLWSRAALRAAAPFVAGLDERPGIARRIGQTLPEALHKVGAFVEVHSTAHGVERFDSVAVLFGFEPRLQVLQRCQPPASAERLWPNLFLAGDVSERLHPSVTTAQADGLNCARLVDQWLRLPGGVVRATPQQGLRILSLNGLRFAANLGILEHEKLAPQPIQVDAELHLGNPTLVPRDDEIHHVLDYRKVRKIIIDECTAQHTNLLESLIGKLSQRLMQLPGVVGVRVRIAKLEIFDDCEVAIRTEVGLW